LAGLGANELVCSEILGVSWVQWSICRLTAWGVVDAFVNSSVLLINFLKRVSIAFFSLFFDGIGCGPLVGGIMVGFLV